jgi:hypothetical protein
MHTRTILGATLAMAVFALAACDQSATGSDATSLSRDDAAALAPDYSQMAESDLGAPSFSAASLDVITTTTTFTRTHTCPVSGSVTVAGTLVVSGDRETHTASSTLNATRTDDACTFNLHSGGTVTVTGNPNIVVTGAWSITNGVPGVRTVTHKGSFNWTRSGGGSGTCTVDLTATWDPATHTAHVQGTFCNRTVDVTRTRSA